MPRRLRARGRARIAAGTLFVAIAFGLACGADRVELASLPIDLDGVPVDPFEADGAAVTAFLFVGTECPISNRYAPELRRIGEKYASEDVAIWFVYPDPDETPESIRRHLDEYGHRTTRVLRDPTHALASAVGVRRTPEVAVYSAAGRRVYRGRINDRFVEFGSTRPAATTSEFADALEAVLAGRPVAVSETEAIGCFITDTR